MVGRFDANGDLWIEIAVGPMIPIPAGVERSNFMRSAPDHSGAMGIAVTEINLTAYIADLVKNPPRR